MNGPGREHGRDRVDAAAGRGAPGGSRVSAHCPAARSRRRFAVTAVVAVAATAVLAGCVGSPDNVERLERQAHTALTRWSDAVAAAGGPSRVVLVGELTGQIGDWELDVGDNNKRALYAGMVEAPDGLPGEQPSDGEIRWPDGTTEAVPVLSAQQAVSAIRDTATAPCSDCTMMQITAATLANASIETSRGPATGPVWEFTLQGTAVKVTRVAIADAIAVMPPPWDANDPAVGLAIDSATGTVGGSELTVDFVGAPEPGDTPCGEDYTTEAVESDLAVVVIVIRHPNMPLFGGCTAAGARRTATVELAAPLGDRAVLDVQQGLPVPVTVTP